MAHLLALAFSDLNSLTGPGQLLSQAGAVLPQVHLCSMKLPKSVWERLHSSLHLGFLKQEGVQTTPPRFPPDELTSNPSLQSSTWPVSQATSGWSLVFLLPFSHYLPPSHCHIERLPLPSTV